MLVVDDEATLAELVTMALRYEGWEVRSAGDGANAVRIARELRPDVVVLDIMLPDLSGIEVLRRLREQTPEPAGAVPDRARTRSRTGSPGSPRAATTT